MRLKKTIIGLMAAAVAITAIVTLFNTGDGGREAATADRTAPVPVSANKAAGPAWPPENKGLPGTQESQMEAETPADAGVANPAAPSHDPEPGRIDPVRLARAELAVVRNRVYEATAREILPTLSIQTHNPVWALEYQAGRQDAAAGQGPQPAPEAGEFGYIQPPEGAIWLRIPPDYAGEHRDNMAQNADLYRTETGYRGPVSVTLWVGGRPYFEQQYE